MANLNDSYKPVIQSTKVGKMHIYERKELCLTQITSNSSLTFSFTADLDCRVTV